MGWWMGWWMGGKVIVWRRNSDARDKTLSLKLVMYGNSTRLYTGKLVFVLRDQLLRGRATGIPRSGCHGALEDQLCNHLVDFDWLGNNVTFWEGETS